MNEPGKRLACSIAVVAIAKKSIPKHFSCRNFRRATGFSRFFLRIRIGIICLTVN